MFIHPLYDAVGPHIVIINTVESSLCRRLTGAASATVDELRNQTSSGFQNALKSKKVYWLDLEDAESREL